MKIIEAVVLHIVCWWGVRILAAKWMAQVLFTNTPLQAAEWWLARLLRGAIILLLILGWVRWRKLTCQRIGLGGVHFIRNFAIGLGGMTVFGLLLGKAVQLTWKLPGLSETVPLAVILLICLVDVLGQQVAVFGILQLPTDIRTGWQPCGASIAAWASFGVAHILINPPVVVVLASIAGALFTWAAKRSSNLGLGAGIHFGYYLLLAVFVGEVRML